MIPGEEVRKFEAVVDKSSGEPQIKSQETDATQPKVLKLMCAFGVDL